MSCLKFFVRHPVFRRKLAQLDWIPAKGKQERQERAMTASGNDIAGKLFLVLIQKIFARFRAFTSY
ncbi:MAG TPA: hypothetical protein VMW66_05255 [Elusimicrobiales bacterium]|nr:hypothetical protein [Elusimicrobiales bacterium]